MNPMNASAYAMLKEHGISMQEDTDNTMIASALQSGRQLVLSDAGKLLLNDPRFKNSTPNMGKQSNLTTPNMGKQSNPTTTVTSTSTRTSLTQAPSRPTTGPSTFKFEYMKKKPTIVTPNTKAMPLETNKVRIRFLLMN